MTVMAEEKLPLPPPTSPAPPASPVRRRPKFFPAGILGSFLLNTLAISLAILFMIPLLFALSAALKGPAEVFHLPIKWLPHPAHFDNFEKAWNYVPFARFVLNTLVITELCVIGTIISSSVVAYGFARFNFPLKKTLFALLISTMLLPPQVTMVPVFLIWRDLHLVNTIFPLVIPSFLGGGAFNVFLMRQFYMGIPRSLDEAAMIDGCSPIGIWWRILVPLSKPAMITVGLFTFAAAWNDFLYPLIYLHDPNNYTVSIGLRLFNDEYGVTHMNLMMAATMIHILPVLILFLVMQRYFVRGIATAGIKE